MPPKGEFEVCYFGIDNQGNQIPCGGLDYSRPYSCLAPNALAPGTVNTQSINGFVCSSPIVAQQPYQSFNLTTNEFVMGIYYGGFTYANTINPISIGFIVTNVAVYEVTTLYVVSLVHTWSSGEITAAMVYPGNNVSFVQINNVVYITGTMLTGIFQIDLTAGPAGTFSQSTTYVAGAYLFELAGRLCVAECLFPTGGGTGTSLRPTIAWSGVGAYAGSGGSDPWNPANGLGGGYNLLADVPDQITGVAAIGRSAFIFRQNGITQQDPGPSGIQPFVWYHLWASSTGVGALPGTIAQFGQQAIFRSSDNIYSISLTGGIQPIGSQMIAKILSDFAQNPAFLNWVSADANAYYTASIVNIAGQLHYLLTFSWAGRDRGMGTASLVNLVSTVYDLNLADGSWHLWDTNQYLQFTNNGGAGFSGFTTPIIGVYDTYFSTNLLVCGTVLTYGTYLSGHLTGIINQFLPLSYDYLSDPYTANNSYLAAYYVATAMPITKLYFRGETISLGHKITSRRIRIQADNAPYPTSNETTSKGGTQQITVYLTADDPYPISSPVISMSGNAAPQGNPIQTYYGDLVKSGQMVQASIIATSVPLANVPLLRLATVSFIGIDTTGTTQ